MRWIERGIIAVIMTFFVVSIVFPWMDLMPRLVFCDMALFVVVYLAGLSYEREEQKALERRKKIKMTVFTPNKVETTRKADAVSVWIKTTRIDDEGNEVFEKSFLGEFPKK